MSTSPVVLTSSNSVDATVAITVALTFDVTTRDVATAVTHTCTSAPTRATVSISTPFCACPYRWGLPNAQLLPRWQCCRGALPTGISEYPLIFLRRPGRPRLPVRPGQAWRAADT
eukprot:6698814-Pyramimonas_sp.AAC.1